jgi:hypothetical protein
MVDVICATLAEVFCKTLDIEQRLACALRVVQLRYLVARLNWTYVYITSTERTAGFE